MYHQKNIFTISQKDAIVTKESLIDHAMSAFFGAFSPAFIESSIFFLILGGVFLAGLVIWLLVKLHRLQKKMNTFLSGKDGKNLETVLLDQITEVKALDQEIQELFEISNRLRELCLKSLHKTNVVRFNPFKDVGGNQSFSVVLLDGKNSGVIISSLHTREGTRVYAKPVLSGTTDGFPFTEEEKQAIEHAINGKPAIV